MSYSDQEKENKLQGWTRPPFRDHKEYCALSGTNCHILLRGNNPVQEMWVKAAESVFHSDTNLFHSQDDFDRTYPCSFEEKTPDFRLFFPDCNYMEVWFERNNARIIPLQKLKGQMAKKILLMFESFDFPPLVQMRGD